MHKGFIDKNRRLFNLRQMQVENVLPEHFAQYYPKFITLLKKYYEWQETESSTDLINHLFASRDINETDITLLSYIEDELLLGDAYFEGFGDTDLEKRAAANFSNILFRSKGTKFAIEWFFRSFYGLDAEVLYPKENIFKVGEADSRIGPNSLKYLTDDKLYQTYALLVRVGIPISKWRDIFKLFEHPAGMYLGGEVLLSDVKNIVTALPLEDVVTTATTSTYSLSGSTSVSEGASLNVTVTGTNVPDNIDAVFYYINHVTTNDGDFDPSFVYDSVNSPFSINSPGYVAINDNLGTAQGSFSIPLYLDSDDTESTETFKIYLKDKNGALQDSATISVNNVLSQYSISIDSARSVDSAVGLDTYNFLDGDTITFIINGVSANPPNQTLQYYLDPGLTTLDSTDFVGDVPWVSSPAEVTVVNDSARITLQTAIENTNLAELNESFQIVLKNGIITKATSDYARINNRAPLFNVTLASSSIVEGNSLSATIEIDEQNIGTLINWYLTGDILSDNRAVQSSGSFVANSTSNQLSVEFNATDSANATGSISGVLNISPEGFTPDPYSTESFTLLDEDPVYTINASPAAAAEGDSATFSVSGTNIPYGTTVYMYVDYNETDVNDFVSPPPLTGSRQAITVTNNQGDIDLNLQFATDGDANESFNVILSDAASGSTVLASREFIITSVPYTLSSNTTTVLEGSSVTFTFDASGITDGTYYYRVSGTNITASDFETNAFFNGTDGEFQVTSGTGTFTVTLAEDVTFEGTETFVADVSATLGGASLVTSSSITILDTSAPSYTISVADIREGQQVQVVVTPDPGATERLYYEISGAAASKFTSTKTSAVTGSTTSPFTVTIPYTASTDPVYNGAILGTVSVSRGDYVSNGATAIDTDTFNVLDAIGTATIVADDDTPDEGTTVTFNVTGSNLPSTVYYSLVGDMIRTQVSAFSAAGQPAISLADTTGITIGMETNALGVPGTVTFVGPNTVTMSQNLTFNLTSGSNIQFALPEVFDDFDNSPSGSVSITSNTGSFTVDIAENGDGTNDVYTFGLYDAQFNGNLLGTETITIQSTIQFTLTNEIPTNVTEYFESASSDNATALMTVRSDGSIQANYSTGLEQSTYGFVGNWITGTFDPANFSIIVDILDGPNNALDFGTSFGTPLPLSSNQEWYITTPTRFNTGFTTSTMTVRTTIYETANPSNSITQDVVFFARFLYEGDLGDNATK